MTYRFRGTEGQPSGSFSAFEGGIGDRSMLVPTATRLPSSGVSCAEALTNTAAADHCRDRSHRQDHRVTVRSRCSLGPFDPLLTGYLPANCAAISGYQRLRSARGRSGDQPTIERANLPRAPLPNTAVVHKLRQLRDVDGDAPNFVPRSSGGRGVPSQARLRNRHTRARGRRGPSR